MKKELKNDMSFDKDDEELKKYRDQINKNDVYDWKARYNKEIREWQDRLFNEIINNRVSFK